MCAFKQTNQEHYRSLMCWLIPALVGICRPACYVLRSCLKAQVITSNSQTALSVPEGCGDCSPHVALLSVAGGCVEGLQINVSGHRAGLFLSPAVSHLTVSPTHTATPRSGTRSSQLPEMPTRNMLKTTILSGVIRVPLGKSTML
jgi:hypothetical protein